MKIPLEQQFPFPVVADAAGVSYDTMKRWVLRGHLVMRDADRETLGRGGRRMLSYYTTTQAIIAADLNAQGVPIADATKAAIQFSHIGDEDRGPGELFKGASTVVYVNSKDGAPSGVLRVEPTESFESVMSRAGLPGRHHTSVVFCDVGLLLLRCARPLGMDQTWILEGLSG